MIKSEILKHSVNSNNDEILSFKVSLPRFIQSEILTHRMFARNSASSRAIPFKKMLDKVSSNTFYPMKWMKNHKGMQGSSYFSDKMSVESLNEEWGDAFKYMKLKASNLNEKGVTKQISNRLLEPFSYNELIITATDLDNFFIQRMSAGTEIHFQELANKMFDNYTRSTPEFLKAGEYHLPFYDNSMENMSLEDRVVVSVARCARVSYSNFNGDFSFKEDLRLYNWLIANGHWSPFEHVARCMSEDEYSAFKVSRPPYEGEEVSCEYSGIKLFTEYGRLGPFKGYIQLRKTFNRENKFFKNE